MTGERKTRRAPAAPQEAWTFLTNHAHVMICIAQDPEARMREIAIRVGITERAVQKIVAELENAGYLTRTREGRRNVYALNPRKPLRHSLEDHLEIGRLIDLVLKPGARR